MAVIAPLLLRDWQGGFLISAALCWPYVLPTLLPFVRPWMLLSLALIAGVLRWQPRRKNLPTLYAFLAFVGVVGIFWLLAVATLPLDEFGNTMLLEFVGYAAIAFLATFRQAPINAMFTRGLWFGMLVNLALCVYMIYTKRSLFLQFGQVDYNVMRENLSTVGFPMALELAACCLITTQIAPLRLFASSIALLGVVLLEVLVRGRYDAIVVMGMAAMIVLAPPWRNMFVRAGLCIVLGLAALFSYITIAPRMGESYQYFEQLHRGEVGGRSPLFQEAWDGFLAHPFGQGIGAFERSNPVMQYPHNLVLQVAYELGFFGLVAFLAIFALTIRRAWEFWKSPPHRMLAAVLIIPFLQLLKAGSLSTFAFQWVLVFMLFAATPLSEHWPLAERRSRR